MANMSMSFSLFGKDVSASKSMEKVGRTANETGSKLKGLGKVSAGVFGGLAIGNIVGKLTAFGKESVDAFSKAAGETRTLQRYLGGTAEDASRLRSAANMTGVSIEDLGKGLGKMSRFSMQGAIQLQHFNDKAAEAAAKHKPFHASLGASAALFKKLGVDTMDSSGKMRSTSSVLFDLADHFKSMPNGIEKTSMVMQIFGKNGMALLPFLSKGKEGLKELGIEADKAGTVLNDKDLKATKEATLAKRKLHEAVEGLQISFGRNLYPIFTTVTRYMSEHVVPVLKDVLGFMQRNKDIIGPLAGVVGVLAGGLFTFVKVVKIVTAVTEAWAGMQAMLNVELDANPIGLIILAVAALVAVVIIAYKKSETFRKIVHGALNIVSKGFHFLWDIAKKVFDFLKPAFEALWGVAKWVGKFLFGLFKGLAMVMLLPLAPIFLIVAGLKHLWKHSQTFRNIVHGALHGVAKAFGVMKDAAGAVFDFLKPAFKVVGKLFVGYINMWISGLNAVFTLLNKIPHIKIGGVDLGFNLPMIPLLGQPGFTSAKNATYQQSHHDSYGLVANRGMNVTVNVAGSVVHERALARTVRDEMAQMLRRRGLPTAAIGG